MTTTEERGRVDREVEGSPRLHRHLFASLHPRTRDVLAFGIVLAALLLPLRGLLTTPGPPMEEGFMLVFPARLLAGDVPNVDFLHLYGPGSLWVLAGLFKLFGGSLLVERLFGFLQLSGVVFGIYFLARRWGRVAAVLCGLTAVAILVPLQLVALAWMGAVALGLFGTLAALASRDATDDRRARALALVAGVLYGAALLYRPDLVLAVGLTVGVIVWKAPRRRVLLLLVALVTTVSLYLVQIAMAGFSPSFHGMVEDPLFNLRGGRHLSIPPPWNHYQSYLQLIGDTKLINWPLPTLTGPHQLSVFFFALLVSIGFVVLVAIRAIHRNPGTPRARALLAVAMFGLGILPQTLQRPDSTHIAWVGCVSIAFVPVAVLELLRDPPHRLARLQRSSPKWAPIAAAAAVPVVLFGLVMPNFTVQRYADFAEQTFGFHRYSYGVSNGDRTFYNGNRDVAVAGQRAVNAVARISKPGERLFVGTGDLRKTPYSEAWLYYLFPDLVPGTYYIEMDPGIANAKGSRLARDLQSSDIAVLSTVWDPWAEPNDSLKFGSDAANQVLRDQFCLVGDFSGYYRVYRRCRP